MKEINENLLALTGKAVIGDCLKEDHEYQLVTEITVYGTDTRSNNDGTFNHVHKAKITGPVALVQGNNVIEGKPKTKSKMSVALRLEIERLGRAIGETDVESFYGRQMGKLIENYDEVFHFLKNR